MTAGVTGTAAATPQSPARPSAPPPTAPRPPAPSLRVRLLQAALQLAPRRHHAVVAGFPDEEGNSVEVVRHLAARMPVHWLVTDPASVTWLLDDLDAGRQVRILRKTSVAALRAYLTAEYVFFTHGLYGCPRPPADRIFVNLWHGDGPKRGKGFANIRSTYLVAATSHWGGQRMARFDVERDLLVTGYPRVDQLDRPADDDALRRLGLDPARPLVLWLPTYRTTEYDGRRLGPVRNWSDAPPLSSADEVTEVAGHLARLAEALGVTVAVKPHALDGDGLRGTALPVLTREQLVAARTTLYQLLARSRGLITDYSSVWTDYLCLDRPIGFYCPDLERFRSSRGLNVEDYPTLVPGPLLTRPDDLADFLHQCVADSDRWRARRRRTVELLGAEVRTGATERLLEALGL